MCIECADWRDLRAEEAQVQFLAKAEEVIKNPKQAESRARVRDKSGGSCRAGVDCAKNYLVVN